MTRSYLHCRGYLPHFDFPGAIQSVTFRLADSLPAEVVVRMHAHLDTPEGREVFEEALDGCRGACLLGDPTVAQVVVDALRYFDGERYRLLAWCVMPNHAHVVVELVGQTELGAVVQGWKSFTARQINKLCGGTGRVWQPDYFDRYVRDQAHLASVVAYVEQNPVKAGLVKLAADWRLLSAFEGPWYADEDVRDPGKGRPREYLERGRPARGGCPRRIVMTGRRCKPPDAQLWHVEGDGAQRPAAVGGREVRDPGKGRPRECLERGRPARGSCPRRVVMSGRRRKPLDAQLWHVEGDGAQRPAAEGGRGRPRSQAGRASRRRACGPAAHRGQLP